MKAEPDKTNASPTFHEQEGSVRVATKTLRLQLWSVIWEERKCVIFSGILLPLLLLQSARSHYTTRNAPLKEVSISNLPVSTTKEMISDLNLLPKPLKLGRARFHQASSHP